MGVGDCRVSYLKQAVCPLSVRMQTLQHDRCIVFLRKFMLAFITLDPIRLCFSGLYQEELLIGLGWQKKARLELY